MSSVVFPLVITPQLATAHEGSRPCLPSKPVAKPGLIRLSPSLFLIVLAVHVGMLYTLLKPTPPSIAVTLPRVLAVRLIVPAANTPSPKPQQPVEHSAPTPTRPVTKVQPKLTTLRAETPPSPAIMAQPSPDVTPAEPRVADASPTVAEPAPPSMPAPIVQPNFDADYLDNPKPPYPALSRRQREEGEVRLRVWVGTAGEASKVELFRSSGFERLDRVALETVQRWRFVPARQGEHAVAAWVIVPIAFNLRSE